MTDATKTSRVEFDRIEAGVLGNCRTVLSGIDDLAADIGERGLLQPLVVWHRRQKKEAFTLPDGREVWDRYILVAGHRRHAAIAKLRADDADSFASVPVTLFQGNEDDALFAQLAENLSREDLTVVDLANAVYRLRARGHTQARIAKRLAHSQAWVSRLLKLRDHATEELLRAVSDRSISFDQALTLAERDGAEQIATLERLRTIEATSGPREARKEAARSTGRATRPAVRELRDRIHHLATIADPAASRTPPAIAHAVLAWVLGEGEWPVALDEADYPNPPPT